MTSAEIAGVVGVLPTPATGDAERWDAEQTIAFAQTEKMVAGIVAAGIRILMTTATFGEVATLTWEELRSFAECVIETGAPHPVFVGVTTLNTRDTIVRARAIVKLGAAGIFTGRPLWTRLDERQIVQYYRDLTEALPGVPIVVYDNPRAFRGKLSIDVYRQLAALPEIVAVRQVGGEETDAAIEALGDRIRFLPNEKHWFPTFKKYPDRALACWSGNVACGPAPMAALQAAVGSGDMRAAAAIHADLEWAGETMYPSHELDAAFSDYSIQLSHLRLAAAGYIEPGPCRPPYIGVPEEYVDGAREVGRRFRTLHERYTSIAR